MRAEAPALLAAALLLAGPARADDCSSAGTRAFRTEGIDAAYAAFDAARQRPECRGDAQLAFNYARTVQAVLDRDGDDPRACAAAEAYATAATADALVGAVRALAAEGRAAMAARCEALRAPAPPTGDYDALVEDARAAVQAGDKAAAAEAWKAASRLRPDAPLPHRALCSLLPDLGRAAEGRGHCRTWRTLEPAPAAPPPSAAADHTLAWIAAGGAVAALAGGALFYGQALGAADEADAAHADGRAAREADDPAAYEAARRALSDANERAAGAQIGALALTGVGVALGGLAAWLFLDDGPPAAALMIDGAGIRLHGRF